MSGAEEFVEGVAELPVMPPIAAQVMKHTSDPQASAGGVADLIARDPALAARVLRIANSSFYAVRQPVDTIQQAVVMLGYSTLRAMVVAASMKEVFARFGLAERLLWEHAVAAAVAGQLVSDEVSGLAGDELFVGGLLHDVGRLVMYSQEPERAQGVLSRVYNEDADVLATERDVFGFDHCEVGRLVLERWRLPSRLTAAVGAHHAPESAGEEDGAVPLAAAFQIADLICLRAGVGRRKPDPDLQPLECEGGRLLGVSELDPDDLMERFAERHAQERATFE